MRNLFFILCLIITSNLQIYSQAGYGVYKFLDLPVSSRMAALGGTNVSLTDNDLNFAFQNPSLLSNGMNNVVGLNTANYLADIQFGSAVYSRSYGLNNFAVGVQFVDYGDFKYATELNDQVGDTYFTAKDYALSLIYSRAINEKISVGGTLKPIYSVFEHYTSFGMAVDAGINYQSSSKLFSAGFVIRNLGTQFKGYYSDEYSQHYEPLPFDIQLGISKKLAHAPLRLSVTLHNLQHWDLNYQSTNQPSNLMDPEETDKGIGFVDMAYRHSVFAVEFVPSKSFYLTAAYNHRRHAEMIMSGFKTMSGFSFGGGIKLYKFHVGFGMTQFQVGNYSYQFSISTSLNDFRM